MNPKTAFRLTEKNERTGSLPASKVASDNDKNDQETELLLANSQLAFQYEEKEKRSAELLIANEKLLFENNEKEKRAAELITANNELAFQNREKEKRASELIIANRELALQNEQKDKRAAELIIANKELIFQNEEKEKRAQEVIIANREMGIIELQLKEVNKELEAFSYSVSHDLRAPLRAISGYSNMLKEDYGDKLDTEANRIIDVIVDKTNMMGQLIDDLLTFSKMARMEKVSTSINMKKVAEKCIEEMLLYNKVSVPQVIIHEMATCNGDEAMLKQVWFNLISNAIKYSSKKEKPQIEIGATENEHTVTYFIKDNGTGFDMKYAEKLFGVFQRLHRQDEFEGTGLGLALARRIVNKHGGEIWAESDLQKGATFYFTIPKTTNNG